MEIGLVGLGRMGGNIARRLMRCGHDVVVHDLDPAATATIAKEGARPAENLRELIDDLDCPRHVWLMVPAGNATESGIEELARLMGDGDTIIDGGNSFWKDDIRRAERLSDLGIDYVDVGTSGGIWGLDRGYCLTVGGKRAAFERLESVFASLSPGGSAPADPEQPLARAGQGYIHAGSSGAGHFVKMIHNGIEYGLMQAYAEGFELLRGSGSDGLPEKQRLRINCAEVAEVWRHGSVITSWLLDLSAAAMAVDPELEAYSGRVQDSGEGRWALQTAIDEAVGAPTLSAALFARFRSRHDHTFGEKLLSAMRKGFGGHAGKC